jgi:hypothetical protein
MKTVYQKPWKVQRDPDGSAKVVVDGSPEYILCESFGGLPDDESGEGMARYIVGLHNARVNNKHTGNQSGGAAVGEVTK